MITYQQEFLTQVKPDIEPLLRQDWEEIEHNKELYKLNPDWDIYQTLEDNNSLRIFTCRYNNKLIGYFVVILTPNIHSKGNLIAVADVIFLDKEYRSGLIGYKLFKFSEACIKEDGIKTLHVTTTEENPIDSLMMKLGYLKVETKFEKVL
jgi:GNAT superfamily N-acetyltransferase